MSTPLPLLRCRICWLITLAVFTFLVLIESIILIPSVTRFKERELQNTALEIQNSVENRLAQTIRPGDKLEEAITHISLQDGLKGLAVYNASGKLLGRTKGMTDTIKFKGKAEAVARPLTEIIANDKYHVYWESRSADSLIIVAGISKNFIQNNTNQYIIRIIGLIILIVIVVTLGTMLVLDTAVLRPLIRVKNSLQAAGDSEERADQYKLQTSRQDEIGELIHAHNELLDKITASYRRIKELADEKISYHARHDSNTGLPNQMALEERLDDELEHNHNVILIQIEYFNFGLTEKDSQLTQQIAKRLSNPIQPNIFCARLGGNSFAIAYIGNYRAEAIDAIVEDLIEPTKNPFALFNNTSHIINIKAGVTVSDRSKLHVVTCSPKPQ